MATLAELMLNSKLPVGNSLGGSGTKSSIYNTLTDIAKNSTAAFSEAVHHVKQVGDFFATNEGISVGLDDIEPEYEQRDALLKETTAALKKGKTYEDRQRIMLDAQNKGIALAKSHKGSLGTMTHSGGRGNFGQLIKTVVAPITVKGSDGTPTDFLMTKSYSEGVTPGEFWMGASEARREAARGNLATALPGDSAKQLSNTLNKVSIVSHDCGTTNGIIMSLSDKNILTRYAAGSSKLITQDTIMKMKRDGQESIKVRSPMTCEDQPGVCQLCYGINAFGKLQEIGSPIGLRAAQALSEPLTQMVLSSKHGGNMSKIDDSLPSGMEGFKQLMDVPQQFKAEASLATVEGRVNDVEKLPTGGYNVTVGKVVHFIHPKRTLLVKKGDYLAKGERISSGVENPKTVTELKGMGAGRKYLLDALHGVYAESGIDMDKRNLEVLVREDINHVKITKTDPEGRFVKGEVVPLNKIKGIVYTTARDAKLDSGILGSVLAENTLHHTKGTLLTKPVLEDLQSSGHITTVKVTDYAPAYKPLMYALERVPSLSEDFIGRMAHRRIKDTLLEGAAKGFSSDKKDSPITNYLYSDFNG